MRKILMIIIIALLIFLSYAAVANGFQIGEMQISSIKQIEEQNKKLDDKINDTNLLIDTEYPKKISELNKASKNMQDAKSEYLDLTNVSSDAEIIAAMQKKSYAIEFLWANLGTHVRKEGVRLNFSITSSSTGANNANDINFTVDGTYIAITNFIYAIENDTELNFRIENFKLLPYEGNILQATFTVRNVAVEGNTSSANITTTEPSTENKNQTNTNEINTNEANTNNNQNTVANEDVNTNTTNET